jgi:hypothetical protein
MLLIHTVPCYHFEQKTPSPIWFSEVWFYLLRANHKLRHVSNIFQHLIMLPKCCSSQVSWKLISVLAGPRFRSSRCRRALVLEAGGKQSSKRGNLYYTNCIRRMQYYLQSSRICWDMGPLLISRNEP